MEPGPDIVGSTPACDLGIVGPGRVAAKVESTTRWRAAHRGERGARRAVGASRMAWL